MRVLKTHDALFASKDRPIDQYSEDTFIDYRAIIISRAKAYQGPDDGAVIGPAILRKADLLSQLRDTQNELDRLDVQQAILEAELPSEPVQPASYNAPTALPANTPPQTIPALIRDERDNARGMRRQALIATSALIPAVFIMVVEVTLLAEVLGYGMPEVAGEENVSTGLLALAFTSVVAGAFFALEKAGPRVRALMDRIGAGAVLIYLMGAGVALGLKGSGLIGSVGGPDLTPDAPATDWADTAISFVEFAAASVIDTLGSAALACALAMITVLSVIAIEHLLRIGLHHAGLYLTAREAASRADLLEADMTRIASGQLRLAREIEDLEDKLAILPRDVAAEINSLAAPYLVQAEEQLAQMQIVEASRRPGFDLKAFEDRVAAFRAGIDPAKLMAVIERADI